ncbi:MAG: hypothetical protein FWD72_06740, partial [Eggerthellaceae bacterium]|nr:hypothetical protein [Eggerthellaceae bacterium]
GMFVQTADMFGLALNIPGIALPIGISFYTFEAISYIMDVYRGEVVATRSYPKMLLFISFFPHLIAGPILKYHDVEKQLDSRKASAADIAAGMRRFTVGLGKKVLIANTMAAVADAVYGANLGDVNVAVAWIGALSYLMQIYFDFSGYSDMAIGLARMFGFRYKENFNYPYISSSIQEFWRRWHISLTTWFKEYLYFPLGGNRKGKARASFNRVVVFFCCGLWHGASWTFVIWGLFHGLFLLLEEYLPIKKLPKAVGVIYALLVVTIGFVLFRANDIGQAGYFVAQMFTGFHFETASVSLALRQLTPAFIVAFVVSVVACMPVKGWLSAAIKKHEAKGMGDGMGEADGEAAGEALAVPRQSTWVRALVAGSYIVSIVLLLVCLFSLSGGGYNPFIYFRF